MAKLETPPPTFRIKLLHERKSGAHRKIDGLCGLRYIFLYDEKLKAYVYTPKTEAEAADIFATVGRTSLSAFAPVSIELNQKPDEGEPSSPDFTLPDVTSTDECIIRGIIITEDDSAEVVERLIKVARKADSDGEQRGVRKADQEIAELKRNLETNTRGMENYAEEARQLRSQLNNINALVGKPTEMGEIITTTGETSPTITLADTRTPAEKRAATNAAKKAAKPTQETPSTS